MKQLYLTFLPLILLMIFAQVSRFLVEDPPYPVSGMHMSLVFLAGFASWVCLALGETRKSYGLYASGLSFGFLLLATALFPDLWLRWPEASLAGLAISQLCAYFLPRKIVASTHRLTIVAPAVAILSILPLTSAVYTAWPDIARPYIAAVAALVFGVGGYSAWMRRQRRFNPPAGVALLFWALLSTGLLLMSFRVFVFSLEQRLVFEELVVFGLMMVGATHLGDQVQSEKKLRSGRHMELEVSMKDPLTNLANRRALETFGPGLITQSRESGRAISILMADIDHFKQINDIHGHLAGDSVLRETATRLSSLVRKSDLVARYGGEEFVILLPGSPLAPALRLAERIRATVESESTTHENQKLTITLSFGVATAFPEEPTSLQELIKRADSNLYRAKREGRNRVCADALPADDFLV